MSDQVTHCYIGIKPCGCIVAAVVDNPEHRKDVVSDLQEFLDSGYTIERVLLQYARENLKGCHHE